MTWTDAIRAPRPRVVTQFAILCLIALVGLGTWQGLARSRPALGATLALLGVACFAMGWLAPGVFRWVYTGAMVVTFPVGFLVSQVLLALLFFGVFLMVGLFLRVMKRDAMVRHRRPAGNSYWEERPAPGNVKRYLRQY